MLLVSVAVPGLQENSGLMTVPCKSPESVIKTSRHGRVVMSDTGSTESLGGNVIYS